ncbi:triose-phosphate isomerase [Beijerinckia indica]|uniref:Triosephosphate isomerase n=1 Tax=Beijerinckia indica subsp. indica (strain ATCC 9039 / DSM 1715 / NCIMB 8712) TaxID=395963 RepID=B2IKQ0_BEII9|nr:triose-phosphate isomerase [Beijerinckia indica]ACB95089.1 Triose-phosphate isomerase [Beijerinckia indica subsp. indica ATCC 9039]
MTKTLRPLIAGNWKMNGLRKDLDEIAAIRDGGVKVGGAVEIVVCPPFTLLAAAASLCEGSGIGIGGQDCHPEKKGAFTGDIAPPMLKDCGATYVILGHSERRLIHGESDALIRDKIKGVQAAGLAAILCVGETAEQRSTGQALAVVGEQLAGSIPRDVSIEGLVIAYEPVWAIGTGLTPTAEDIAEMHGFIRAKLEESWPGKAATVRLLYGGSVKPSNAAKLLAIANVDGALIGGASLIAADFLAIAAACPV